MGIKSELTNDPVRGPGYGLIRILGLSDDTAAIAYCLERNQGSLPYLGEGGVWQSQAIWHRAVSEAELGDGRGVRIGVGPEIVDPIVEQPPHVMCRLTVDQGGTKYTATLKIQRPLLSSNAQAATPPPVAEPETPPEPAEALPVEPSEEEAPVVPLPVARGSRRWVWPLASSSILVVALAAGAWLWWDCRIPGLPGPECAASISPAAEAPKATVPRTCAGLQGDACLAAARQAASLGQLELARQLLQEAGGLGVAKAYIDLAHLYDPATWAAEKSPVERADWETAAYWYDEAARVGDPEGILGAGRLYCGESGDIAFISHGAELLKKAAAGAPPDAEVRRWLEACEEKLK